MMIIGVDYHPSFQTIAFLIEETGECGERELNHSDGEAERFYRELKERGVSVRVGMEATGHARWFERLLAELGFELWIGDPAEIKTKRDGYAVSQALRREGSKFFAASGRDRHSAVHCEGMTHHVARPRTAKP